MAYAKKKKADQITMKEFAIGFALFFVIGIASMYFAVSEGRNNELIDRFMEDHKGSNLSLIAVFILIYSTPVYIIMSIIHFIANEKLGQYFENNFTRARRIFNGVYFASSLTPYFFLVGPMLIIGTLISIWNSLTGKGTYKKSGDWVEDNKKLIDHFAKVIGVVLYASFEYGQIGEISRAIVIGLVYLFAIGVFGFVIGGFFIIQIIRKIRGIS